MFLRYVCVGSCLLSLNCHLLHNELKFTSNFKGEISSKFDILLLIDMCASSSIVLFFMLDYVSGILCAVECDLSAVRMWQHSVCFPQFQFILVTVVRSGEVQSPESPLPD